MLEVRNVSKVFNAGTVNERVALNAVDLTLQDGEFVTVIGGNGAGKSTMLNCVAGVYPPDAGSIMLDGIDLTHQKEHRRAAWLGRVFQDPMMGTAGDMGIEENLSLALHRGERRTLRWGVKKQERALFVEKLAELDLGLEERLTTKVGLLSGGQRQAITLVMATLKKPQLLLLDEHTAALDPRTAKKVLDITDRIVRAHALTTMMVTHNMADAIAYGDRLIMFYAGRIILDIRGEEKRALTVPALLQMFETASGDLFSNDGALLA